MQAVESLARSLTARTVHVKMTPTPKTFSERREVLRVLERFGKVDVFKGLKYNAAAPSLNTFITVFEDQTSAEELLRVSPIRYKLISHTEPTSTSTPEHEHLEAISHTSNSIETVSEDGQDEFHKDLESEDSESVAATTEEKIFQLTLSPSSYPHLSILSSPLHNPLHGPYTPISPRRSLLAASLSSSIPPSIYSAGLRDWETDGVKRRVGNDGGGTNGGWGSTNVPWRIANKASKQLGEKVPDVMRGLKGLHGRRKEEAGETAARMNG
ncbi:hypothetical protein B7463_g10729, partial [Scytalidium lignicola]